MTLHPQTRYRHNPTTTTKENSTMPRPTCPDHGPLLWNETYPDEDVRPTGSYGYAYEPTMVTVYVCRAKGCPVHHQEVTAA